MSRILMVCLVILALFACKNPEILNMNLQTSYPYFIENSATNSFTVCADIMTSDKEVQYLASLQCAKFGGDPKLLSLGFTESCFLYKPMAYVYQCS